VEASIAAPRNLETDGVSEAICTEDLERATLAGEKALATTATDRMARIAKREKIIVQFSANI
jgi:hypothetical protein